ncbi:hypothetical protein A1Q1_02625 [Trichosporon asahii var. asahii CBS 2479]|uniref:non-specific serine/threonine protein kinase n=1 Tax=Trichosporon asahii var. asahii (strain ATCC 90039 / CBS 2479 / JCM 2466 / KCTC 7840 / NBRC 103889/ NCYC 2677 / UAMH 7654) TaxID=1186058 RepID=J6EZP0_TRIAS|nr:hypothetical protein A1Q1_02625 [Trichosporon asahii var. asahii CBS 2479]EJT48342.1 hypothetical protein A1Q1_02625 [Trichosporon asahii var. asahii CBS 2479]
MLGLPIVSFDSNSSTLPPSVFINLFWLLPVAWTFVIHDGKHQFYGESTQANSQLVVLEIHEEHCCTAQVWPPRAKDLHQARQLDESQSNSAATEDGSDRVSMIVSDIEKKWIAFQLLTSLRDARMNKVSHGDIKSDNVLITTDLTVLVTDFSSSFKPTYLPIDDPADFSFFFDTSARRTCYIAPERFYGADSKIAQEKAEAVGEAASDGSAPWEKRTGKVTEEMDVFSAGCVLAETWTDGRTVFNLSELFAYKDGQLGLDGILDNLEDKNVKMLSRNPSDRPTFDRILNTFRGTVFPEYFYTFLKDYITDLSELPDSPEPDFLRRVCGVPGTKVDQMLEQWDSLSVHLEGQGTNEHVFVRATYARALVRLADAAVRMLEISHASQPESRKDLPKLPDSDYDSMLAEIQNVIEEQATMLLVDSNSNVKRSMLASISDLCLFFGRQKSSDAVLSHIMTYLNDRDWQLRLAFFDGIVTVGAFIGIRAIHEYVLPLMLQALAVVARVIASLSSLASLGLLKRMYLWDVYHRVLGFLYHPNTWIRQSTAGFIAAAARNLPTSDVWCILYPSLRSSLRSDIVTLDEDSILNALSPPLAKSAALQRSPPGFWDSCDPRYANKSSLSSRSSSSSKSDSHLLKDKGITAKDEKKVVAMKDFIYKQAESSRARGADTTGGGAHLRQIHLLDESRRHAADRLHFSTDHLIGESSSRRSSFASRSNRGDNPAEEIRKRLIGQHELSTSPTKAPVPRSEAAASDSVISSAVDGSPGVTKGHVRHNSKALPAVTSHATATGTTSVHEDSRSGQSTPVPGNLAGGHVGPLAPYSSTYEGADPGVRAFLEQVDLENYREPLLDFGPRVVASHRKRGPRPRSASPQQATMIAHLPQHTGAVTAIVTAPDQMFFATASEDSSILIWDIPRLERSVAARPRLTYRMEAPVSTMCRIEETHCLAAASEDGAVHVLRVHASPGASTTKYKSIDCIRTWRTAPEDGYVIKISHLQGDTGTIGVLDMRSMELKTRFQHPLELGPISAVCPSTHWVVIGTVTGALSLWDLRFGLLLKSWAARGGITSCAIHPSRGRGRWIMVSVDRDDPGDSGSRSSSEAPLVETYDIETSKLVEVFEVRSTRPPQRPAIPPSRDVLQTKSELIAELAGGMGGLAHISADSVDEPSVQSLLVGQGFASLASPAQDPGANSWMVTAGDDRVIRYWDLAGNGGGFVICGSPREKDVSFKATQATPQLYYTLPNARAPHHPGGAHGGGGSAGRAPNNNDGGAERGGAAGGGRGGAVAGGTGGQGVAGTSPQGGGAGAGMGQRQPLRPHYDSICCLGMVETPFSSCIVSADRSGVIKVWRIEGSGASSSSGAGGR